MQTMDTKVDRCTFTGFYDFFFYLFTYFSHYFFDACGVDTSVGHKLMQCQTGNFTSNRGECGKNDCFRSIINNDFHTGGCFQSTDITSFTSDDTSFDFIRFDMEYRYGVFDCSFRSYPLDRLDNDTFCFFAGSQFGIIHNIVDE